MNLAHFLHNKKNLEQHFLKTSGRKVVSFNKKSIQSVFRQVVSGLDYIHEQRILHRDIKPHNILVDPKTLKIKIADFGLSRRFVEPFETYSRDISIILHNVTTYLLKSMFLFFKAKGLQKTFIYI